MKFRPIKMRSHIKSISHILCFVLTCSWIFKHVSYDGKKWLGDLFLILWKVHILYLLNFLKLWWLSNYKYYNYTFLSVKNIGRQLIYVTRHAIGPKIHVKAWIFECEINYKWWKSWHLKFFKIKIFLYSKNFNAFYS
jgi:hypothetical protein